MERGEGRLTHSTSERYREWNVLPNEAVNSASLNTFENQLDKAWKDKPWKYIYNHEQEWAVLRGEHRLGLDIIMNKIIIIIIIKSVNVSRAMTHKFKFKSAYWNSITLMIHSVYSTRKERWCIDHKDNKDYEMNYTILCCNPCNSAKAWTKIDYVKSVTVIQAIKKKIYSFIEHLTILPRPE